MRMIRLYPHPMSITVQKIYFQSFERPGDTLLHSQLSLFSKAVVVRLLHLEKGPGRKDHSQFLMLRIAIASHLKKQVSSCAASAVKARF
jgi:hypothetical protein